MKLSKLLGLATIKNENPPVPGTTTSVRRCKDRLDINIDIQTVRTDADRDSGTIKWCFERDSPSNVVDKKSRECGKLKRGGAASSSGIANYSECCCILLCDRTTFDDVCCIIK